MNIFRTLDEENLIKKDLELQKKSRKLNELSKFIEEKIIEFNLNIGKTNLKEVSKHAKLIESKIDKSKEIEKNLIDKVNEKIKYIEELQIKLDSSIIYRTNILKKKENMLIQKEKDLERQETELLEKQKFLFN